jgi:hypothetical protein
MTDSRSYWVVCFTLKTWEEASSAGGNIAGFRHSTKGNLDKLAVGDYLLCYLTGLSRFVAVQEVKSEVFEDDSPIWKDDYFPLRVKVKDVVRLDPETAVPVVHLSDQLSIFENLKSSSAWGVHFRTSPKKWKDTDGKVVVAALTKVQRSPIRRSVEDREKFIKFDD